VGTEFAYDFSGFASNLFQSGPTGISRVDVEGARYFASTYPQETVGLHQLYRISTRFPASTLSNLVQRVEDGWSDFPDSEQRDAILAWLRDGSRPARSTKTVSGHSFAADAVRLLRGWPWHRFGCPVPDGCNYINVSYANARPPGSLAWLRRRPGVRAFFMVHDLIPLNRPEWFWDGLEDVFRRQIELILGLASGIFTPSEVVASAVREHAITLGLPDLPVRAVHLPTSSAFHQTLGDGELPPFFVMCGTIEPRKNHMLILDIWGEMARRGLDVPKLLLFGKRGWKNEAVFERLEQDHALRPHVLEIADISTPDLAFFVSRARALLMPSFDEGFGLPVAEGLACGTPVVASDIPVFREIAKGCATLCDPGRQQDWMSAIMWLSTQGEATEKARLMARQFPHRTWSNFYDDVVAFVRHPL